MKTEQVPVANPVRVQPGRTSGRRFERWCRTCGPRSHFGFNSVSSFVSFFSPEFEWPTSLYHFSLKKSVSCKRRLTISSAFSEQLIHRYNFAKKLQSQTVNREKLQKNTFVLKRSKQNVDEVDTLSSSHSRLHFLQDFVCCFIVCDIKYKFFNSVKSDNLTFMYNLTLHARLFYLDGVTR